MTEQAGKKRRGRWFDRLDGVGCIGEGAGCLLPCLIVVTFGFAWMN